VTAPVAGGPLGEPVEAARTSPWNLPNALTLLRIALVPVVAFALAADGGGDAGWRLAAFAVFVLAMATDRLDGELARRRGLITNFGIVADPIADKALIGTVLLVLSAQGRLPWWVTVVVLVRELGITALRFVVIRHGIMPASRGGKLKTTLQSLALALYLLPLEVWFGPWAGGLAGVVMALAVLVTVVTGVDYVQQAYHLREGSARTAERRAAAAPGKSAGPTRP
jgi:CDP-diacylglycerol--glycerol-3-phosphate 3-phosphatidyltransferase